MKPVTELAAELRSESFLRHMWDADVAGYASQEGFNLGMECAAAALEGALRDQPVVLAKDLLGKVGSHTECLVCGSLIDIERPHADWCPVGRAVTAAEEAAP